ncbi:hypothetical protein [Rhizobium leguminosarum]|uniref:hypothetical protein n=1 Tax=Rhizobium leguminosarum TaxID=384 RepID=UPI0015F9CE56|nr:hypothetical protein [Rhizobium leguminosarum]MBA8835182.1 hypothetical protein [Rhizobium leguminosarum]
MPDLDDRVRAFLKYYEPDQASAPQEEYQSIFADEGKRKAEWIISDLTNRAKQGTINLDDAVYLSIGGADGSEIIEVLENTGIRYGVLLEYDDGAAQVARDRARKLQAEGKQLFVSVGDASQRLANGFEGLPFAGKIQASTIICSMQAVIHEMPTRSSSWPGYGRFLGRIFRGFPNRFFYAREPHSPLDWPDIVEVKIPGLSDHLLYGLANFINDRLRIHGSLERVGDGYVLMSKDLAVECLHKLLRSKHRQNFNYEMGEQLTSFRLDAFVEILGKYIPHQNIHCEFKSTDGFRLAWEAASVEARTDRGAPLTSPTTHVRILGGGGMTKSAKTNLSEKKPVLVRPGLSEPPENRNISTADRNPDVIPSVRTAPVDLNFPWIQIFGNGVLPFGSDDIGACIMYGKARIPNYFMREINATERQRNLSLKKDDSIFFSKSHKVLVGYSIYHSENGGIGKLLLEFQDCDEIDRAAVFHPAVKNQRSKLVSGWQVGNSPIPVLAGGLGIECTVFTNDGLTLLSRRSSVSSFMPRAWMLPLRTEVSSRDFSNFIVSDVVEEIEGQAFIGFGIRNISKVEVLSFGVDRSTHRWSLLGSVHVDLTGEELLRLRSKAGWDETEDSTVVSVEISRVLNLLNDEASLGSVRAGMYYSFVRKFGLDETMSNFEKLTSS